jgi:hypothetical protein
MSGLWKDVNTLNIYFYYNKKAYFLPVFLLLLQLFIRAKGAPTHFKVFAKYMVQKGEKKKDDNMWSTKL